MAPRATTARILRAWLWFGGGFALLGTAWALIPHPHTLVPPSALVEWLRDRHEALRIILANDKIDHVVGFALLMGWFCQLDESGSGRARVTVALLARAARVVHGLAPLPPLPDTVGVRALADEKVARRLLAAVPLTNGSCPPLARTSARGSTNRWTARYALPGAAGLLAGTWTRDCAGQHVVPYPGPAQRDAGRGKVSRHLPMPSRPVMASDWPDYCYG